MGERGKMKVLETSTATVKMTSGVPFTSGKMSDSSDDEEIESNSLPHSLLTQTQPVESGSTDNDIIDNLRRFDSGSIIYGNVHNNQNILNNNNGVKPVKEKIAVLEDDELHSVTKQNVFQTPTPSKFISDYDISSSTTGVSAEGGVQVNIITNTESYENDIKNNISKPQPIHSHHSGKTFSSRPNDKKSDKENSKSRRSNSPASSHNHSSSEFTVKEQNVLPRLSTSLENKKKGVLNRNASTASCSALCESQRENVRENYAQSRFNPFNKHNDLSVEEDHFSDGMENYFRVDRHSSNSTKSSSQGGDWWQEANKSDVTFAELGLSEDHFSHPQGHFGLSSTEELELAIENCKEMIKESQVGSDKQKNLVLKLVQLRIKLHEVKEGPEQVPDDVKVIMSHKMMLKTSRTSKYYCEKCNGAIWGMLQRWYRCTECGYRCHEKCLQQILRTCAKAKVLEDPTLIMELCPTDPNGLTNQNFRCWECRTSISYKPGGLEPRMCDYTGRYYCELCHWNDTFVIPARVLHNWDFKPQKVCRASKQFLRLMMKKAVIRIQDINPMLFVYVNQLNEIKKLREEMMIMKKYIVSCISAMAAKLLLLLESRQHFVESSDRYSMQDLLDAEDVLLPELTNIHMRWAQHIKVDCELCQGRGFCCELCQEKEVLFPFDNIAVVCPKCSAVSHRHCFAKRNMCPRCERREKRQAVQ
ncbi:differentially expressed in FDCP 8 homolog [Physella acuta]|uniref:differentially expressed in FDCP 8 homolog n=1 Tax=Physella acuta TaxID=109671 RepID=UPI0027DD5B2C|nr:differentially expressed in FDCP 8 homolog [Physella acuta]